LGKRDYKYKDQARTLIRKNQSDLYEKKFEKANLETVNASPTNFPYVAVLEEEGQRPSVVGFAAIDTGVPLHKHVLFNLVVNKGYRRIGIGVSLLDFLLKKYREIDLQPSEGAKEWYKNFATKRHYNYSQIPDITDWWTMYIPSILDDDDDDVAEVTLTVSNWEDELAKVDPETNDSRKVTNLNMIPDMSSFKKAVDSVRGNNYENWLSDDFINEYIQLLSKENPPTIRPTTINSFTKLLFPINLGGAHWVLLYMEPAGDVTKVYYLDPYREQTLPKKVNAFAEAFLRAANLPKMLVQPLLQYQKQQKYTDTFNCGVFVLQYMKHIALYNDPDAFTAITPKELETVRKRMIQEIIEQELIVDTKRTRKLAPIFFGTTVFSTVEKKKNYKNYIKRYIRKINSR
jgi:GNAT superfamily N-acetyltransferase